MLRPSLRKSKNRYFTTFGFPWGRPWGNQAKCCMHGMRIRCLQIVSLNVPSNYNRFSDRARWSKIVIFSYPLAFNAPLKGSPSEQRHPVWHAKTRMDWLPDGEKISKISLFVLAQLTNVTDRQTPGVGNIRAMQGRGQGGFGRAKPPKH